ncbi:MAG TPA: radical SAM protein [Smithellaceae bacterium]|nr:radical SAM protein [Smithellaceae bacterium]
MAGTPYKYVYGPVLSRRLGRSLGIDIIPFKTCTYDCIYCQLGKTTNKTIERRSYAPVADILNELKRKLMTGISADYISVAGSGEPTLHSDIGELIIKIKSLTDIPVAVITNGSLLWMREVQEALMPVDIVLPSLDAGDEALFQYVNRPHEAISFTQMVDGLVSFAGGFSGEIWLEIMLLAGVTGMDAEIRKIAVLTEKIKAAKIQLNTVCRPALEDFACALDKKKMEKLAELFSGKVDIINDDKSSRLSGTYEGDSTNSDILDLLARRPCSIEGICSGLVLNPHDAAKRLRKLLEDNLITILRSDDKVFYKIKEKREPTMR